jgi:GT2 family glycosyltransferase/tetratricopeptide (TPR) repeat protein
MIVKNEADELPSALSSVRDFVDEIVVYDTGSSDETVAIARRLGARVIEGYWDDDFARARNACLEHCNGEWILWLDADESIHGDFVLAREQLRSSSGCDAHLIAIESLEGNGLAGHITFHASRLFRREQCEWWSPIHEQVVLRATGELPPSRFLPELRILHRGYMSVNKDSAAKLERNLRLARLALERPDADRPYALFNLGRTLIRSQHPEEGVAPLREAAETTTNATLRQHALGALARLELMLGRHVDAFMTVQELRAIATHRGSADTIEALIHLHLGDFHACLDVLDRMAYLEVDDTGIENGRHTTAWIRARALVGLNRPSEAADALLEVFASHGILDEPLEQLVSYLEAAGREVEEIANAVRPECVAVMCASTAALKLPAADRLLRAIAARYPERLEPIAIATTIASRLPIARALYWSDLLRRRGLEKDCPVLAIAADCTLEPIVRLRACAAALGSFGDQRAVALGRQAFADIDPTQQRAALDDVAPISPVLATLLASRIKTIAVQVSCDAAPLAGYVNCSTFSHHDELVVELKALPFKDHSVHDLVLRDVLAMVAPDQFHKVLAELHRVCAVGARLEVRVPNLIAAATLALEGHLERARTLLFGKQHLSGACSGEVNRNAWTVEHLCAELETAGFAVRQRSATDEIALEAVRQHVEVRQATGEAPRASIVILAESDAATVLSCLRSIAEDEMVSSYEVVIVDQRHDAALQAVFDALSGDITVVTPTGHLSTPIALALATRHARGDIIVVVADHVILEPGSIDALLAGLGDCAVGGVTGVLLDAGDRVMHAGYDLYLDPRRQRLEAIAHAHPLEQESPGDVVVDSLGPGCFAVPAELLASCSGLQAELSPFDQIIDLSLQLRARGARLVVAPLCVAFGASLDTNDEQSRERLSERWLGDLELPTLRADHITVASLLPSTTLVDRVNVNVGFQVQEAPRSGGVNLVGRLEGESSSAYRTRSINDAIGCSAFPIATLNYHDGRITSEQRSDLLPFQTTLLAIDGEDFVAYAATIGLDAFRDRYTIASWHYPMAEPVTDTTAHAAMVAEIWAPTEFARRALMLATNRNVITMPTPIAVPAARERDVLGMPSGFVFAAVVECDSPFPGVIARTNPHGVVRAFCEAFSPGAGPQLFVRLIGARADQTGEQCRELAGGRRDVVVVSGPARPGEAGAIAASADCYVSLHRSAAFGHGIVQAMAAGTPVIATAYGGPLDYLEAGRDALIGYALSAVGPGRLPYAPDHRWAEPDLEHAARTLVETYNNAPAARRRASQARRAILDRYGLVAAGRAMTERLATIDRLRQSVAAARTA